MALFFLLVGLELKRELLVGELASVRDAALPVIGALGGMAVPGLIYYLVNPEGPALAGWGIPTATDIAFAVGILVLLAWRVPKNLIVFLTALAIADDLGAVAVIAIFYTAALYGPALAMAAGILGLLLALNRGGVRHPLPYGLLGLCLWLAFLDSGIHATLAGVLLAFAIPARPAYTLRQFQARLDELSTAFHIELERPEAGEWAFGTDRLPVIAENLEQDATRVQSPQQRIEHGLTPWVNFGVIPLFALANAGIDFSAVHAEALLEPVTLGVLGGLAGGKFIGIAGASYLAVRLGRCRLPVGVRWRHLLGASWLGGIGFTMSLFIAELAFPDQPALVEQAKMGILAASLLSGLVGLSWLYLAADLGSCGPRGQVSH
jgi:NhaA family Na+:H+ antiporter